MSRESYKNILSKYVPKPAVDLVYELIVSHHVHLNITRERKTRHGDFRPAVKGKPARISVNHNLNPYAFLITFLHELAHQLTWKKYKRKVKPHGPEWKQSFADLLRPFIDNESFPAEIADSLNKDSSSLLYSTASDTELFRQLKKYDQQNGYTLLENLPDNALFITENGSRYRKLHKRRKNFLCENIDNRRNYIFNPLAEVIPLE